MDAEQHRPPLEEIAGAPFLSGGQLDEGDHVPGVLDESRGPDKKGAEAGSAESRARPEQLGRPGGRIGEVARAHQEVAKTVPGRSDNEARDIGRVRSKTGERWRVQEGDPEFVEDEAQFPDPRVGRDACAQSGEERLDSREGVGR